jgi:A/G-specific adenine glycosylase
MRLDFERMIDPLLKWYQKEKRELPWRKDKDPYHIWVSEIMLQQTRVEAVKGYYARFLQELPDIASLAACPEEKLLKLWEGLGYYNRVRNMKKAAVSMMEDYGGLFPSSYEEILGLSGIGSYTAGAIASIAFSLPYPAVDGNVLRILMRVADDPSDISKAEVKKRVEKALKEHMPSDPGSWNQALMELGALVCLPNGEPHCQSCPWNEICLAKKKGTISRRPVKSPKKARRKEERAVLIISDGEKVLLHKRPKKGLLAGLYEFPNLEGKKSREELLEYAQKMGEHILRIQELEEAKHIFTHVEWHMKGYLLRIEEAHERLEKDYFYANLDELEKVYAIPSAFRLYTDFAKKWIE